MTLKEIERTLIGSCLVKQIFQGYVDIKYFLLIKNFIPAHNVLLAPYPIILSPLIRQYF